MKNIKKFMSVCCLVFTLICSSIVYCPVYDVVNTHTGTITVPNSDEAYIEVYYQ